MYATMAWFRWLCMGISEADSMFGQVIILTIQDPAPENFGKKGPIVSFNYRMSRYSRSTFGRQYLRGLGPGQVLRF